MWTEGRRGLVERPSKRARAFDLFDLRTWVETDGVGATEIVRMRVGGTEVREMVKDGDDGEDGRENSRAGMGIRVGIRGGEDERVYFGSSGKVIEGAGLADGIDLIESRERGERRDGVLLDNELTKSPVTDERRTDMVGLRFILAERIDCDSAKSRDRKDLYSG